MTRITMPQAGQSMEEGTILCWRKSEGEQVRKGEILLEIETDKANVEVEAAESGVLRRILCPAGTTVPVRAPIAILAGVAEDIASEVALADSELRSILADTSSLNGSAAPTVAGPASVAPPAVASRPSAAQRDATLGRIKASPAARKGARELGVELKEIGLGTGPGGRVLSSDVVRAASQASAEPTGQPVRRPLSGMRRAIARNLVTSKQSIPHFYMRLTIDAEPLTAFHRVEKAKYPCTLNDVLTFACARVIREFPVFRARIENEDLTEYPTANIGIAVGMEEGLRVPVLVAADRMSLREVAAQSRRIIDAAKVGKVEAMGQGVLTISNLGMYGVEEFAAIINPPEAAVLAVGAIREAVTVSKGAMRAGRVMTITLSADHRIIDGLAAARFLNRLKAALESPDSLGK
ncbi:MAG TPA: dihydrolipoamide acetyltransferase family protein [Acidobacteriota bacterium]|nr:dihydrolipoamide acetyltransferase family protein [Acidobacteriota bacterium]